MKRQMKITYSILGLAAGATLLLASGCGNQEQPTGETSKTTPPAASDMQKAPEAPKPAAEPAPAPAAATPVPSPVPSPVPPAVPAAVPAAAAQVTPPPASQADAAATAAAAMSTQAQALIDKAKGLVTDQKYQDALNVVQELSSLKLTDEQQKLADELKAQIQAALAKAAAPDAASALGNALGGKK